MSGSILSNLKALVRSNRSKVYLPKAAHSGKNRHNALTFILSSFHALTCRQSRDGFTLIEIIVTIVISAVLATILAQVMASQTWRSYVPVQVIDENLALRAVMDNMASDYRQLRQTDATPLVTLQSRIRTSGYYWDASKPYTNGVLLQATTSCIGFDVNNDEDATLENADCQTTDTILKVTLAVTGSQHRLTALFTR